MTRLYRGTISYAREDGGAFGREFFTVSVEPDGSRTLRCLCEMDDIALVRDVTYTVDQDFRAIDCFVRVSSENQFIGAGWFRFTNSFAEGQSYSAANGHVSQKLLANGRPRLFGTHPLSVDIWKCIHIDRSRPDEVQALTDCFNCSSAPNGASGPLLAPKSYDMVYQGAETVTVPAGEFACERYDWQTGTGRTLNLYTVPGDWLPVRTVVPEMGRYYDLVEFEYVRDR
jgi:hypothetical protein